MKKKNIALFFCIIGFLFSIFYLFNDLDALLIFIIWYPISLLFFFKAFRDHNITLIIFILFFTLAHGINPSMFFLYRDSYSMYGWNAIGSFRFNVTEFMQLYLLVYMLMLFILIFSTLFIKKGGRDYFKAFYERIKSLFRIKKNRFLFSSILICLIYLIAIPLNIFMFENKIGIVGLQPKQLPFRISGILYYLRNFVIPFIILILYSKSSHSNVKFVSIVLCALIAGFSSASRSVLVIYFSAVLVSSFIDKKYAHLFISIIVMFFLIKYVSVSRNITYSNTNIDLLNVINFSINQHSTNNLLKELVDLLNFISSRLYGAQPVVLASQHLEFGVEHLLQYLLGNKIGNIVPNMTLSIYGMSLPDDKNYGVALGLIPQLIMFSQKNILKIVFEGLWISIILSSCENFAKEIIKLNLKMFLPTYAFVTLFVLILWMGDNLFVINILTLSMLIIRAMIKNYAIKKSNRNLFSK